MPCGRMLITVVIKFTAPRIDEIPARCSLKIAKSTDAPPWAGRKSATPDSTLAFIKFSFVTYAAAGDAGIA
jgi:hypothetical protein